MPDRPTLSPRQTVSPIWSNSAWLTTYAIGTSFCTYFCMYALRKPFSAAKYEDLHFLGTGIDLKTAFVVSQILGYALSKVIGISFCSQITANRRATALLVMVGLAQFALLLFAILPEQWKVLAMFLNGLPLGMVWGLVVWYLEGRRTSELLLAGLSCSFIVASGAVKDVGVLLMTHFQVPQFWMPFTTGLIFLPAYALSVWLLNRLPPPSAADVAARVERQPMTRAQRRDFVMRFAPGLALLMLVYFFLTAYRDYRDNFGVEIFRQLNYGEAQQGLFTFSELWVMLGVMAALAGLNLIRDNRWGLIGSFAVMAGGTSLLGIGTWCFDQGLISGLTWVILCGLGSYLAYVPFGSVLFDRLIASTRAPGTAVFAIYVADSIGYGGAISVLLTKDIVATSGSRLDFLRQLSYSLSLSGTICLLISCLYFVLLHTSRTETVGLMQPESSHM